MMVNEGNIEMMLFELLEGNLDEATSNLVKQEIATNPLWEREWKLMQQTVLIPEGEIVFTKKDSLLRPVGTTPVTPLYFHWLGWSAAACLIFFSWFGIQNKIQTNGQEVAVVKPIDAKENVLQKEIIGIVEEPKPILFTKERTTASLPENPVDTMENGPRPISKESEPILGLSVRKSELIAGGFTQDKTLTTHSYHSLPPQILSAVQIKPTETPEPPSSDKGIKNAVVIGMAKWIDPYRHPKLKLAAGRSENRPVLMLTLNTNKYHAAAMFQLKTNSNE